MQNDITQHLSLPLPHPDNELQVDVARLRDALSDIDAAIKAVWDLVASDDVNLDTVQEIVTVLKQAGGDIDTITAALATKANAADMAAALLLKANIADVTNQLALKADAAAVATSLGLKAATAYVDAQDAAINLRVDQIGLAGADMRGFAFFLRNN